MDEENKRQRREWERTMDGERRRKDDLEELRKMVESTEKKTPSPRDLIRLLVKAGEMRPEEASSILRIDRSVLDRWCRLLEDRGYVEVEGLRTQNEIMRPTSLLMDRVRAVKEKSRRSVLEEELEREKRELEERHDELAEERKKRVELEEKLESANEQLKEKQKQIEEERLKSGKLQDRLFELGRQVEKGLEEDKAGMNRLEGERDMQAKTEETLKRKRELIERNRMELEGQKTALMEEKELKEREKLTAHREEQLRQRREELDREEEELALLLDEGGTDIKDRIKAVLDAIRRKRRTRESGQEENADGKINEGR